MAVNEEIRRLEKKWAGSRTSWPKRLNWIQIKGMRGWAGQRIQFDFPIVAVVGENGSGKSSVLQAAACVYRGEPGHPTYYPTEFFPDTAWDTLSGVSIAYGYAEGERNEENS